MFPSDFNGSPDPSYDPKKQLWFDGLLIAIMIALIAYVIYH